jgi:hypothetical protein
LLQSIDYLMEDINKNTKKGNRNLLLLSSFNAYLTNGITKDSVISKAKRYGIKISTILDRTSEDYIEYSFDTEKLIYELALNTGGFIYNDDLSYMAYDNNILILASRLGNILEGNFRCFESTWKIVADDTYTIPFQPGYIIEDDINLLIDLGTQYNSNVIELPFRIIIK